MLCEDGVAVDGGPYRRPGAHCGYIDGSSGWEIGRPKLRTTAGLAEEELRLGHVVETTTGDLAGYIQAGREAEDDRSSRRGSLM